MPFLFDRYIGQSHQAAAIFVEKARHLSKYGHDVLIYTMKMIMPFPAIRIPVDTRRAKNP